LTSAKHPALSTNQLTDIEKTKHNYSYEQDKEINKSYTAV